MTDDVQEGHDWHADAAAANGHAEHEPSAIDTDAIRRGLIRIAYPGPLSISLLMVADHRGAPRVFDVPISTGFAAELLAQCAETANLAAEAEFRPAVPGFVPGKQQWLYSLTVDGPLAAIEPLIVAPTHEQYDSHTQFGRQNLLVMRLRTSAGAEVARVYQGFSPEKALVQRSKLVAVWSGDRFEALTDEPLIIDRQLRLIAIEGIVVMQSAGAFESLFGALSSLRVQAAQTFQATIANLDIVGLPDLAAACSSDLNMMRKLVSIQAKLDRPGYANAINMPALLAFLAKNKHIDVPVDTSSGQPKLVFSPGAQHRWAILKLLDDDFLRSDLTDINYEANSKSEVL